MPLKNILALLATAVLLVSSAQLPYPVPSHVNMLSPELMSYWGHPGEAHAVTTQDGYELTAHRVGPRWLRRGPPVLLLPGLGSSSEYYLHHPNTLAFQLARAGYDVWLANFRGCFYGKKHVNLTKNDPAFWDFSWHENGVLDIPAHVDYILARTGRRDLLLVCHSMGCTASAALLSERPEYNARVRAAAFLAPPVFFRNLRGGLRDFKGAIWMLYNLDRNALREVAPFARPTPESCFPEQFGRMSATCRKVYSYIFGPGYVKNQTRLQTLYSHYPRGASMRQLVHFEQVYLRGHFARLDLGPEENLRRYGERRAAAYNLNNIVAPVYLHYSDGDYMASEQDVRRLAAAVPGSRGLLRVPAHDFNHMDFLLTGEPRLFEKIIAQLKAHSEDLD